MTRRSSKWPGIREQAAAFAVAALILAGCGGEGGSGAEGDDVTGPLRIATPFEISTLDPLVEGFWSPEFGYGEQLMRPTPDAVPEPWILESAEAISETEWELTLHEGVTFHNGNPCDAEAVAALLNHQIAENVVLQPILPGAKAEATGPTTVILTTTSPVTNVPNLLAHDEGFLVYDVETYLAAKKEGETFVDAGIYTGPYEVRELTAEQMVLERNDDYWQGEPALPGVEIAFIADAQARVLAVESGEIDIALYPPTEAAGTVENSSRAHYATAEKGTLGPRVIFNLHHAPAPIDDVLVRQALVAGVDYEAIANDVMDGYYDVAEGMYPMHLPFAVANQKHNPEKARSLLDQAGWVESGDGFRVKNGRPLELTLMTYRADPDLQTVAVALRSQLEEIGVRVVLREIEDYTAIQDKSIADWHAAIYRTAYMGIGADIVGIVQDYFTSDGARNYSGIKDPEIDALAEEISRTFDEERLHELLRELQEIMITEKAYTMVAGAKRNAAVVSDEWRDYKPHENYIHVGWQTAP